MDRIESVTDGVGQVTRFAYDIETRVTTVTDPLGVSAVYEYGADGELTRVRTGVTAANPDGLSELSYTYNAIGDVTSMTDGLGNTVLMEYDERGNLTKQVDGAGNTVVRTYDARNQLLTETAYALPETGVGPAEQPQTTRYVYDAAGKNQLRFVVSPEGRVTEYRYQVQGLRTSGIQYTAAGYDVGSLAATEVPTEAELQAWVRGQDLTRSERSDMAYDFRGNLQSVTTYGNVDAAGNGVASTASGTWYVYDQRGQLLQTVTPDGRGISQNVYDGLGRVVSSVARSADGTLSTTTVTQYDDANGKTTVTLANGLSTTSVFDRAGRLISVLQSSADDREPGDDPLRVRRGRPAADDGGPDRPAPVDPLRRGGAEGGGGRPRRRAHRVRVRQGEPGHEDDRVRERRSTRECWSTRRAGHDGSTRPSRRRDAGVDPADGDGAGRAELEPLRRGGPGCVVDRRAGFRVAHPVRRVVADRVGDEVRERDRHERPG